MLWLVVTGSREIKDTPANRQVIHTELLLLLLKHPDAFLIVGDARGLDTLVLSIWCTEGNRNRHRFRRFEADWGRYGLPAGPRRNREMIQFACDQDGTKQVLAFYQTAAENKGTANCANTARRAGLPVKEIWIR